jgi:hypothetical protein
MTRSFSLYPPVAALAMLAAGIGMVSIPAALIVVGALALAAWCAYFTLYVRRAK